MSGKLCCEVQITNSIASQDKRTHCSPTVDLHHITLSVFLHKIIVCQWSPCELRPYPVDLWDSTQILIFTIILFIFFYKTLYARPKNLNSKISVIKTAINKKYWDVDDTIPIADNYIFPKFC